MADQKIKYLYGLVGAERMHTDIVSVFELEVDDQFDPMPDRIEVEEFSVTPQRNHLMSADALLEWVHESACDEAPIDENWCDHMEAAVTLPDVVEAAEALLTLLASKNGYLMADQKVQSYWITFDRFGEPLVDGALLYVNTAGLVPDVPA